MPETSSEKLVAAVMGMIAMAVWAISVINL